MTKKSNATKKPVKAPAKDTKTQTGTTKGAKPKTIKKQPKPVLRVD